MRIPVVGPTYTQDSRAYDAQRCVNLIPEVSESGTSKGIARLIGAPGLELALTAGGGPHRPNGAITTAGGRCFFISGNTLYELDANWNATDRGQISTAIGPVSMCENGTYILIVDGNQGHVYTLASNNLAAIADAQFPQDATVCAFQDTYFIVNDPDTGDFYIAQNDPTSWTTLDKATVESSPDNLRSLVSDHGELFLAGSRSMEAYSNTGNSTFPFQRISQAVLNVGIAAAHTLKAFDNTVLWVSEDGDGGRFVYEMTGSYRQKRVSNQAVEKALSEVSDISGAYAWVYKQRGHEYYCLQVPGLSTTWVLDAATRLWHERMYYNQALGREELHRGACHTFFNGFNLVGDRENGKIYKLKLDCYSDNGDALHAIRITPHLSDEMRQMTIDALHLDMETGVGLAAGQGSDPQVMMQVSKNGGRTFGNERWKDIGALGKYYTRARWTQLGSARDWVFKFVITDPVQRCIIDCYAGVRPGMH